jgi:hypothetical protein
MKSRITAVDLFHSLESRITAQVIHEYHLVPPANLRQHFADVLIKREDVPFFVMHRGNDGDVDVRSISISRKQKKTP